MAPKEKTEKVPDLPPSCSKCIFRREIPDQLICHRHAPSPGPEEDVPARWPPVLPSGRCVEGSLGNDPDHKRLTRCEGCGAWDHPPGGVRPQPYLEGDKPPEWWRNSGYCILRAPFPTGGEESLDEMRWKVTHYADGCGDGIT